MLKKLEMPNDDLVGIEAQGEVTADDYKNVLHPIFDAAKEQNKKIRFLFYLGPDFKGYTLGAGLEDMKLGFKYLNSIERCAVVTDKQWISKASRFFGSIMPCPVQAFPNNQLDDAKKWLDSGDIALDHHFDPKSGVLQIEISAPLSSSQFEILSAKADEEISKHGELKGLVIHTQNFPGWQDLGSLFSHITFVKDHHKKIKRVALSSDSPLAELLPHLSKHFVSADVKHFDYSKANEATQWAAS